MIDVQQNNSEINNKKVILLNLKSKSSLEEDRGFINDIENHILKTNIDAKNIVVVPIVPFSFFFSHGKNKENMMYDMPDNWENAVKKIDVYDTNASYVHDAVRKCVDMCSAKYFSVTHSFADEEDANNVYKNDIALSDTNLIANLMRNENVPIIFFDIRNFLEIKHMLLAIEKFMKIIMLSKLETKAVIAISVSGDLFFSGGESIMQIIYDVVAVLEKGEVPRNSYKLVWAGELVDYLAISPDELNLTDGFCLNVYDSEEHIACSKLVSLLKMLEFSKIVSENESVAIAESSS